MALASKAPLFAGPFIINFFPNDKFNPKFKNALEAWYCPAEYVKQKDGYICSYLHEAAIKGKWHHVNFAPFTHKNVCCFLTVEDEGWMKIMREFGTPENKPNPGGFEEVDAYDVSKISGDNMPKSRPETTRFTLADFNIPGGREFNFEQKWKNASGTETLAKAAGKDFVNACLYRRWTPFSPSINYVVRSELLNLAGKEETRGKELVAATQGAIDSNAMDGYVNLYKVILEY